MLVIKNEDRLEYWVFLVFRHARIGITDAGESFTQPEVQGVFTTPELAESACHEESDTVFPVQVNKEFPRETHENSLCWWPQHLEPEHSKRPDFFSSRQGARDRLGGDRRAPDFQAGGKA